MKRSVEIDEKLLEKAIKASEAKTPAEAIRLGLEALVQRRASQRLREYLGSEPDAQDVPRRREPAA